MAGQSLRPDAEAPADPTAQWRDELVYRSVIAATGDEAGAQTLRELVRQLAIALDVAYAFVAEFDGSPARVRTVALWGHGGWLDDIEYELAGTPCEEVAQGAVCHHADGVQQRFPQDRALVDMGARGYLGVPLVGAGGVVLGHLAVMDTKPLAGDASTRTMVELVADRARVELERVRAEIALERASRALEIRLEQTEGQLGIAREQLAALVRIQRAVAGHLERRTLFAAVAEALRGVLPADRVILFVRGDDPATLNVYAAYGDGGVEFFEGESIPREGTVAGWVAEHGTALVVSRTADIRTRFPVSYERLRAEGMDSMIVLPLVTHGRSVGSLTLMAAAAGTWDVVPRALLDEMAASVAVAFASCVAYEELGRLGRELRALLDVNLAVGRHLERDGLFRALAACLHELVPSDRFGIELPVDGDRLQAHVLSPDDVAGAPTRVEALPAAGTACRWTEETRQWIVAATRAELAERFPVTFEVMSGVVDVRSDASSPHRIHARPLRLGDRRPARRGGRARSEPEHAAQPHEEARHPPPARRVAGADGRSPRCGRRPVRTSTAGSTTLASLRPRPRRRSRGNRARE